MAIKVSTRGKRLYLQFVLTHSSTATANIYPSTLPSIPSIHLSIHHPGPKTQSVLMFSFVLSLFLSLALSYCLSPQVGLITYLFRRKIKYPPSLEFYVPTNVVLLVPSPLLSLFHSQSFTLSRALPPSLAPQIGRAHV